MRVVRKIENTARKVMAAINPLSQVENWLAPVSERLWRFLDGVRLVYLCGSALLTYVASRDLKFFLALLVVFFVALDISVVALLFIVLNIAIRHAADQFADRLLIEGR